MTAGSDRYTVRRLGEVDNGAVEIALIVADVIVEVQLRCLPDAVLLLTISMEDVIVHDGNVLAGLGERHGCGGRRRGTQVGG